MSETERAWPYPTVPVNGEATVDEDGDTQTCACGNDSWALDWCHATREGRLRWMPEGSADPAEFAVCPLCGRVYANSDLFEARDRTASAIARYETNSAEFIEELSGYNRAAYE